MCSIIDNASGIMCNNELSTRKVSSPQASSTPAKVASVAITVVSQPSPAVQAVPTALHTMQVGEGKGESKLHDLLIPRPSKK